MEHNPNYVHTVVHNIYSIITFMFSNRGKICELIFQYVHKLWSDIYVLYACTQNSKFQPKISMYFLYGKTKMK